MNAKRHSFRGAAVLLAGSLVLAGLPLAAVGGAAPALAAVTVTNGTAAAPLQATPAATSTMTATTQAVSTTIAISPTTVNRGGLVTVSGKGFAANENVFIFFNVMPKTVTTAKADANGDLPATGVSVPYALKPAMHTISALGATSKRSAHAQVTVQNLTPSISVDKTAVSPGDTVTVSGKGYSIRERVTISLNGAALATLPAVVVTTNGDFTAAFKAPSTLLSGTNTISALGNKSRITAITAITGTLPVAAQFYFAGGMNSASEHSFVNLLNANGQPASVHLTFYQSDGATSEQHVTVAPTSEKVVSVADYGLPAGTFGLYIKADRQISAQINIARDGKDGDNLLGSTGLDTTWYLAEGYTGLTFHEDVSILNPDPAASASVVLHLLPFGGHPGRDVPVTVAAHSNHTVDINSLMPNQSLSIIATSDHPVVVERSMSFSSDGYGLTTRTGTHIPATSWIFAEGTTTTRFQTFLTILNPNTTPARVTASFFGSTGGSLGSRTIEVAGRSRANIKLNDFLHASGIASVVTSDLPVVVERPEYFGSPNDPNIAGSDVFGRNGAGARWSFPGGNTANSNEYLLLYNPSFATVPVDVTFYGTNGKTMTKRVYVPPTVRFNINVNTLAAGFDPAHGAVLRSASAEGFVAEQTIFAPNLSTLRSTQGFAQ